MLQDASAEEPPLRRTNGISAPTDYPITLVNGKRSFVDGTIPAAFKLTESKVGSSGVIHVNYERAGDVKTGSF